MTVETHNHPDIDRQINGFGERVNAAERTHAETRTKAERNERDIQNLFALVGSNAETISEIEKSVAAMTGKIAGAVAVIVLIIEVVSRYVST
jgi:hypothetical protein